MASEACPSESLLAWKFGQQSTRIGKLRPEFVWKSCRREERRSVRTLRTTWEFTVGISISPCPRQTAVSVGILNHHIRRKTSGNNRSEAIMRTSIRLVPWNIVLMDIGTAKRTRRSILQSALLPVTCQRYWSIRSACFLPVFTVSL